GDGVVGPPDLAQLLAAWGPCPGCAADLNGNGQVDPGDLAQLLAAWGECPGGVEIMSVDPPAGGPGTELAILGSFPSDDPYDYCVVLKELQQPTGGQGEGVLFAPLEVSAIIPAAEGAGAPQIMLAQIGPVPGFFQGEVVLEIVPGVGFPIEIPNPFPIIKVTDDGACWGDPQPGGANIIFNVGGFEPGVGACGPGWDISVVGMIIGGSICLTIPPGPLPNGVYPAGTRFEVWPRYHSCDGTFALDCGTLRWELLINLSASGVAGIIEGLTNVEIDGCAGAAGPDALATGTQICLRIPDKPACAGNFVICIDLP
ncbi:MAG: hypothetical protein KDC98_07935, partial [Planctomycetes bacterium]|nr:hypothetical protein [Planctomycetota bacterium]